MGGHRHALKLGCRDRQHVYPNISLQQLANKQAKLHPARSRTIPTQVVQVARSTLPGLSYM